MPPGCCEPRDPNETNQLQFAAQLDRVVLRVVLPLDEESTDGPRRRIVFLAPEAEHLVHVSVQPLDAALGLGVMRSSMHDDAFGPEGFDVFDDIEHELHRKAWQC